MKTTISFLLLFLLVSCSTTRVNYDFDKQTDFTSYSTYNYFSDLETGLSELDEKRLLNAIDISLAENGFLLSEEPDIFININSTVFRSQTGNNVGVGLGGGGRNVGGGVSIGIPVGGPKLIREIQIEFIDANKNSLIWQAISTGPFREGDTPIEKQEKIQLLVAKIFAKYPPD